MMSEMNNRLYILVDESLEPVYGCVQGGHAVAEYLIQYGQKDWKNEYLIYLYANVEEWRKKLCRFGMKFAEFYEPDLDNKLTALAVINDGKFFKKLKKIS